MIPVLSLCTKQREGGGSAFRIIEYRYRSDCGLWIVTCLCNRLEEAKAKSLYGETFGTATPGITQTTREDPTDKSAESLDQIHRTGSRVKELTAGVRGQGAGVLIILENLYCVVVVVVERLASQYGWRSNGSSRYR